MAWSGSVLLATIIGLLITSARAWSSDLWPLPVMAAPTVLYGHRLAQRRVKDLTTQETLGGPAVLSAKPTGVLALITSGELHNLAVACSWSPLEMPFSRSVTDCTSSANEAYISLKLSSVCYESLGLLTPWALKHASMILFYLNHIIPSQKLDPTREVHSDWFNGVLHCKTPAPLGRFPTLGGRHICHQSVVLQPLALLRVQPAENRGYSLGVFLNPSNASAAPSFGGGEPTTFFSFAQSSAFSWDLCFRKMKQRSLLEDEVWDLQSW